MEISNKGLALLLVAAVAVSVFGMILSINKLNIIQTMKSGTGFATSSGNASLYINTTSSLRFSVATIDWGTGSVNATTGTCYLNTEGLKSGCTGFTTVSQGLVIENDGDTNLSVTLVSDKSPTTFIGSGATFLWKISQNESGSCPSVTPTAYTQVNTSAITICTAFQPVDATDTILVDLNVSIPLSIVSSGAGQKVATLTAVGT